MVVGAIEKMKSKVSLIVLNWNGVRDTPGCAKSRISSYVRVERWPGSFWMRKKIWGVKGWIIQKSQS